MLPKIYRTLIFSVVSYGHESWYLMLKNVHELRALEKKVLRRVSGGNG
jgi:hypothetical protein